MEEGVKVCLERAIDNSEIYPVYQPIIRSSDYSIAGYEVLARWKTSEGEHISPDLFIRVAEDKGLLLSLTKSMMNQAVTQLPLLAAYTRLEECTLAFNISYTYFLNEQFEEHCIYFMHQAKKWNIQLIIEITERERIKPTSHFLDKVSRLRNAGCLFSLDDYGTGYSDSSVMTYFTPDYIKLDKLFASQIKEGGGEIKLTDDFIAIVKKLGISIIAEGVETQLQAKHLQGKGVEFLQGFYFYKPLNISELAKSCVHPRRDT